MSDDHLKYIKRLYSEREAATYLGRTLWAIREMRYRKKLPFVKDGKRIMFDVVDLDNWISEKKIQFT